MLKLLLIGLGGFAGAILRHIVCAITHRVAGKDFPWGTLVVNLAGSFLLGVVLYLSEERSAISPATRTFVAVGVLGAFTTFSTFGGETVELLRGSQTRLAAANVIASVLLALAAVWAGRNLPRAIGM
jgi:CrcB protein